MNVCINLSFRSLEEGLLGWQSFLWRRRMDAAASPEMYQEEELLPGGGLHSCQSCLLVGPLPPCLGAHPLPGYVRIWNIHQITYPIPSPYSQPSKVQDSLFSPFQTTRSLATLELSLLIFPPNSNTNAFIIFSFPSS